jgi:hypothetical protein
MPSAAYASVLQPLLADAADLVGAHEYGRTGKRGRQWNLSGLNRSVVVIAVSAWEAYVESVVAEAVDALKPTTTALGVWPALKAHVDSSRGRFHSPSPGNVQKHVAILGLTDVTQAWSWRANSPALVWQRVETLVRIRHEIAHGLHPRPVVHQKYAAAAPTLIRKVALCTDEGIRADFKSRLGVSLPW